jgi:hypothetical protein
MAYLMCDTYIVSILASKKQRAGSCGIGWIVAVSLQVAGGFSGNLE